jgi:hypothetical protein
MQLSLDQILKWAIHFRCASHKFSSIQLEHLATGTEMSWKLSTVGKKFLTSCPTSDSCQLTYRDAIAILWLRYP